ncbi:uncharacterized protein LOC133918279 [Phragmites australis]|uniref:uncharacterized protein LOC133918279 n=1 Tax=Phragmites australis TaxID=29695 RepID=UPI002D771BC0|nr:uncharacterized protein LOC133918279 [Phragmites australis]
MGTSFSAFNKFGLPGLSSVPTGQVYEQHFKNKKTGTFEDFHLAYIEFCKYFNIVMPGKDFDTPPTEIIREFYDNTWKLQPNEELRREEFFKFMEENVKEETGNDTLFIMAGLAAPAAAVIGKRASAHIPYVKSLRLEYFPNVVFVPLFTLFAIVGVTALQTNRKSTAAKKEESAATTKEEEKSAATTKEEEKSTVAKKEESAATTKEEEKSAAEHKNKKDEAKAADF